MSIDQKKHTYFLVIQEGHQIMLLCCSVTWNVLAVGNIYMATFVKLFSRGGGGGEEERATSHTFS